MSYKIVFMGTPEFSIPSLEKLIKSSNEIVCIYTQPPKKSSRGQKINQSKIHKYAKNLKIMIRNPEELSSEKEYKFFKSLEADIVVVVAYGKIIPKRFLSVTKKGFINLHASLLPKWRGAAPIQRSIMNLDKETGISIMKINEELDTGPVMKQIKIKLGDSMSTGELSKKLSELGAEAIIDSLDLIFSNKARFIEQDEDLATYSKKIKKEEAKINWNENTKNILAKINGLNPNPGAWFKYRGVRYKIWKASIFDSTGEPGTILDSKFRIACTDGSIEIIEIQKEGKNKLLLKDFLLGFDLKKGEKVE